uniref:C3H1-type domain-containing protein n=1 Tax=Glossina morsitans morsitans TaxID=37546 RepID=A0A1B0GBF4_GLOMM
MWLILLILGVILLVPLVSLIIYIQYWHNYWRYKDIPHDRPRPLLLSLNYWSKLGVPHEKPLFLLGNMKGLGYTYHWIEINRRIYAKFKDSSPIAGLYTFLTKAVIVMDLDLIKNILIKDFQYSVDRDLFHNERDDPLTGNLVFLDGEAWRMLRQKMSTVFTSGKVKSMFSTIVKVAERLEQSCDFIVNKGENQIEMKDLCARFTTDVIGECAFGIGCNSLEEPRAEFREMGRNVFEKPRHSMLVQSFMFTNPHLARQLRMKYFRNDTSKFFMRVVKETIKLRQDNQIKLCMKDYLLPNSEVILEKGLRIIIPIDAIHNDPEYFKEPEKFNPDRFSSGAMARQHPAFSFLPFGEGPRNCIGMRFGKLQAQIGLMIVVAIMFITVFITLLVIMCLAAYLKLKNIYSYWSKLGVPHEKPLFFLGNMKGLGYTYHWTEINRRVYAKFKDSSPIAGLYTFLTKAVIVMDLDLIKNILIKDFQYFSDRGIFHNERDDPLTGNLLFLDGEPWRVLRQKISAVFTSGKVKFMFSTIVKVAERLEQSCDIIANNGAGQVEVEDLCARFTTDVIGTCAFGIECNSLEEPRAEFREMGRNIFEQPRHSLLVQCFMLSNPNLARRLRMKAFRKNTSKFFMSVVKETIKFRKENHITCNDFMDLLIQLMEKREKFLKQNQRIQDGDLARGLTFEQACAQAMALFLAGFDTSLATMSFCLYELALNPDIQRKLREEMLTVLEKYNSQITYESLKEMTYLEQVFNETLRKYPVVPLLPRICGQDYYLPNSDLILEKGLRIIIPIDAIHNDPEYFKDPEKFNPDRFSSGAMARQHPAFSFLPFGEGPRNCFGMCFAKLQTQIVIVMDLDLIKNILVKDFQCFSDRGLFHNERDDPLTGNLLFLDGDAWRMLRQKMSADFTGGKVKSMFATIVNVAAKLEQACDIIVNNRGHQIEVEDLCARFTTDVIGTCAFGIECNSLEEPRAEFREMGRNIFEQPRHSLLVQSFMICNADLARQLRMKIFRNDTSKFFMSVVKETIKLRKKDQIKRNDFMDLLIELMEKRENLLKQGQRIEEDDMASGLTFEQACAQAMVFFVAGFDTSSSTMSFCLYELALNPDIQRKLREEILTVLDKYNSQITYESLKEMTYLEQVFNETLRKYPVVPLLPRVCVKDYRLPNSDLILEKGLRIIIPIDAIQNDPEYFKEPEIFNPDRFSSGAMVQQHPTFSFLPFGEGPRNCFGMLFGKLQTQIGLIVMLRKFHFSTTSETKVPLLLIMDLNLIKNILVKDFQCFSDRGLFHNERDDPLTGNLLLLDGDAWRMLRQKMSGVFTSGKVKVMFFTIVNVAERLEQACDFIVNKGAGQIEVKDLCARFTTDVIGECAFGIECNSLHDPKCKFRKMSRKLLESPRYSLFIQSLIFTNPNLARRLRMKAFGKRTTDFFMGVVRETIKLRRANQIKQNDFMDLLIDLIDKREKLLKQGQRVEEADMTSGLTFEQACAQAIVFFLAGFDTSSATMSFCLYELALNPDIQRKLREEILTVLEKYNSQITYESLKEMTYLEQVFNETLRKYPVVPLLPRVCVKDYRLPNSDLALEKGLGIIIPIDAIHNDPEYFEEPEIFNPDRFSSAAIAQQHPAFSFLPFGEGPRNCIGMRFGKLQTQIGLITMLRKFQFSTTSETKIPLHYSKNSFLLTAESGICLQIEKLY